MSYSDCIVFLLAKAYQKSQSLLKSRLKPFGLTPVQALVLEVLMESDGLTAGEIGKRLMLDNATLSGVLERLAEGQWVNKQTDAEDKRVLRIFLSSMAREMKPRLASERDATNEEIMAGFSMEERIVLKRLLRDIFEVRNI
ncbi:MAG: MarR family transcriptional regulator [Desulfobacteraceae bacterium]|nr:MarR family transcriptional regulator [Desulfobacteraceae bacterium]